MITEANTVIPKHISLEASVLVILKEKVILKIKNKGYPLAIGETRIIRSGIAHYLHIVEDTEALHIMPLDNKINCLLIRN